MSVPCILIPLLVGLISAYLGYLLGKLGKKSNNNDDSLAIELKNCHKRNQQLEIDLANSKNNRSSRSNFVSDTTAESIPFDAALAKLAFGKKVNQDDLKIIEGIGPKIEELFKKDGLTTWKLLGEASVDRCQKILDNAGERYTIHNPGTWPRQSMMAYKGEWKKLKEWQDSLDGGKE